MNEIQHTEAHVAALKAIYEKLNISFSFPTHLQYYYKALLDMVAKGMDENEIIAAIARHYSSLMDEAHNKSVNNAYWGVIQNFEILSKYGNFGQMCDLSRQAQVIALQMAEKDQNFKAVGKESDIMTRVIETLSIQLSVLTAGRTGRDMVTVLEDALERAKELTKRP